MSIEIHPVLNPEQIDDAEPEPSGLLDELTLITNELQSCWNRHAQLLRDGERQSARVLKQYIGVLYADLSSKYHQLEDSDAFENLAATELSTLADIQEELSVTGKLV